MSGQATAAELFDAVYYASTVLTLGADPDRPGHVVAHTFRADDHGCPIPAHLTVAALRALADAIERGEQ